MSSLSEALSSGNRNVLGQEGANPMIVDWHAHVYPPELAKERRWGGASPLTIENLLEAHERAGIDLCVVSNTIHYLRDKTAEESLAFLRRWNDYGAEIQQQHRDRSVAFTRTRPW